jgi:hypothetical protein
MVMVSAFATSGVISNVDAKTIAPKRMRFLPMELQSSPASFAEH